MESIEKVTLSTLPLSECTLIAAEELSVFKEFCYDKTEEQRQILRFMDDVCWWATYAADYLGDSTLERWRVEEPIQRLFDAFAALKQLLRKVDPRRYASDDNVVAAIEQSLASIRLAIRRKLGREAVTYQGATAPDGRGGRKKVSVSKILASARKFMKGRSAK